MTQKNELFERHYLNRPAVIGPTLPSEMVRPLPIKYNDAYARTSHLQTKEMKARSKLRYQQYLDTKHGTYKQYIKHCPGCNKKITVRARSTESFEYRKSKTWCSSTCALQTAIKRKGHPKHMQKGGHGKYKDPDYIRRHKEAQQKSADRRYGLQQEFKKTCIKCGKEFTVTSRSKTNYLTKNQEKKTRSTCSLSCQQNRQDYWDRVALGKVKRPNYSGASYRAKAFRFWGKKCFIDDCDFTQVVVVHHIDHDRQNNRLSNLIPLCPNHHAMTHWGEKSNRHEMHTILKQIQDKVLTNIKE